MKKLTTNPSPLPLLERRQFLHLYGGALLAALLSAGCGGGSDVYPGATSPTSGSGGIPGTSLPAAAKRGQVRFTIKWPEKAAPTRLIPQAAQSIKFICKDADDEDELIMEQVVPRGQSVVTLDLPSVRVRINAEAFATEEGTGPSLARGGVTVVVKESTVTSEKLTLDSVITQVKLSQTEADLPYDQSLEVNADALDAEGAVVLTMPENWEWIPENAASGDIVSYQSAGPRMSVRAKKDGSVAFAVKERETGKTARLAITSHGPQQQQQPDGQSYEFGLNIPAEVHVAAGDTADIAAIYKHPDGTLEDIPLVCTAPYAAQLVGVFNGRIRVRGIVPTKQAGISVNAGNGWQNVRIITKGRLLVGSIFSSEPGADVRCAVYLDDSLVASFTDKPNEMGAPDRVNMFKLNAAPGLHRLRIVNLSNASATITVKITDPFRSIGYQDMGMSANTSDSQWIRIPEEE